MFEGRVQPGRREHRVAKGTNLFEQVGRGAIGRFVTFFDDLPVVEGACVVEVGIAFDRDSGNVTTVFVDR